MRSVVKYIVARAYRPVLVRYLSKTRAHTYKNIRLEIPPQVFHPGFFHSTKLLLRHIRDKELKGKTFLEPGAGSGLLSVFAAKKGAVVTATDINPIAIKCLERNASLNSVDLEIIHSDLFERISKKQFDLILINPPYYAKDPVSYTDHAWYCGEKGEYFQKLFAGINDYMHEKTEALMVLCDGCDISMIKDIATANNLKLRAVQKSKSFIETNFIFSIEPVS